jgi:ubiquinone/menaquinone biosynthesis C-methylase UbiE
MDPERLKQTARTVFDALAGAMTSVMIHIGDRMGFYRALADGKPRSPAELAEELGLDERWVREWIHQQGAAGLLDHDGDGRFSLSEEARCVLADENHPAFGAGFFAHLPQTIAVAERLPEAFRTGLGVPYDAFGPEGAAGIERGFAPWFRALLVPLALPRLPGVVENLETGIAVADVGCGTGVAILEMAKAFPKSEFHGFEISEHALRRAEENRSQAGADNVTFHDARSDALPDDGRFDLVTTFDCLHDMTHPQSVMGQIRKAIADDGTWFVADIKAHPTWQENVERNPMAPMMYGISVMTCMSSALSAPDGAGLGTLGLHPQRLGEMVREAGFSRIEEIDLGHPVNAFYSVRP